MTHRERFFNRITGKQTDRTPFFPDLSKWYEYHRNAGDVPEKDYLPGELIPPGALINKKPGKIPERYRDMNLFDIHRDLDCGLPVHGYGIYYDVSYPNCEIFTQSKGDETIKIIKTPKGELRQVSRMAKDRSTITTEHLVKTVDDFPALKFYIRDAVYTANYDRAQTALDIVGDLGYVNMIAGRSPYGRLVVDLVGIVNLTYIAMDHPDELTKVLEVIHEVDSRLWEITAKAPGRIAFIADNMDESLYSPPNYKRFCLPVYQEMTDLFHRHSKIVLAHNDGRLKNLLPMIKETGIDVLDGCTPAPMNDFSVQELADALGSKQYAYCGVPANFFVEDKPESEIIDFAKMIVDTMGDRVILNVGDIMPEGGDIEIVRKICESIK